MGGRFDDDDLVGLVAAPRVALVHRGSLGGARGGQRVAAAAADPGHAVLVHEDGGAGLEDGLEAVGGAVAEGVVGDPGVGAQDDGRQAAQEVGDLPRFDVRRLGEGLGLGLVGGQEADLLFHVAAAEPLGASVQAGGGRVDGADALARRVGQRGLYGGGLGSGRGGGEGVGAGGGHGLEVDLLALGSGGTRRLLRAAAARRGEEAEEGEEGGSGGCMTTRRLTWCRK